MLDDDLATPGGAPKRVDGITKGCKVTYLGEDFAVLDVSDSNRLRGLELRCAQSRACGAAPADVL